MSTSPLERLGHHHLGDKARSASDLERREPNDFAALFNTGLATPEGERLLFVSKDEPPRGFALTTLRIIGDQTNIPLAHMTGARSPGPNIVELFAGQSRATLQTYAAKELVALTAALGQAPPLARIEPPTPLVFPPTPGDELGILNEMNERHGPRDADPRGLALLALAALLPQRRPEVGFHGARDLAARAALLHRSFSAGRGMMNGWWVSPLPPADLYALLPRCLGPAQVMTAPDFSGTAYASFQVVPPMIHAAHEAICGRPARYEAMVPLFVEVRVTPVQSFSSFQLRITPFGQPRFDYELRAHLFESLATLEAQALLLRAIFGWQSSLDQWLHTPLGITDQALATLGAGTFLKLSDFFVEAPPGASGHAFDTLLADARAKAEAELARPPRARLDDAKKKALAAIERRDAAGALEATLSMQHLGFEIAEAHAETIAVYERIAHAFPPEAANATYGIGDCLLFSAIYAKGGATPEHVTSLERALAAYDGAVAMGYPQDGVDENYWETANALARVHPDPARRRDVLEAYRRKFPRGAHVILADQALRQP